MGGARPGLEMGDLGQKYGRGEGAEAGRMSGKEAKQNESPARKPRHGDRRTMVRPAAGPGDGGVGYRTVELG